jgi:hypothetical protein
MDSVKVQAVRDDILSKPPTIVNIDPLKSSSTESLSNVGRKGRVNASSTMNAGTTDDSELDNITQQNLLDLVKDMPEVRPEVVSSIGRKMADDPSYPTDEMIQKFATLMVDQDPSWMDAINSEPE